VRWCPVICEDEAATPRRRRRSPSSAFGTFSRKREKGHGLRHYPPTLGVQPVRKIHKLNAMPPSSDPNCVVPIATDAVIDVCVCTFQRTDSLSRLLASLAAQRAAPRFRVVIADNHPSPVEAERVAQWAESLALPVAYVHAPAGNISVARNACLDYARAEFIAFIDDDEVASPDWLALLVDAMQDADIVFGPAQARYSADMPAWIHQGDFYSKVPAHGSDGSCDTGHTANVLIRRRCIGALRFDPALGRSGGEDTLFFALLKQNGARLRYCASAPVYESIDDARTRFSWLCQRAYASGQAHARVLRFRRRSRLAEAPLAALKVLYCAIAALSTCWSAVHWRRNALRACLHLGVATTLLGARDLELYGSGT
jgi:succinoglycan biosynthesis protein ExoM